MASIIDHIQETKAAVKNTQIKGLGFKFAETIMKANMTTVAIKPLLLGFNAKIEVLYNYKSYESGMAESKTVTSGADDQYPRGPGASLERVQHEGHGGSQAVQHLAIGNTAQWKLRWEGLDSEWWEELGKNGFSQREDETFERTDAMLDFIDSVDELVW